MKLDVDKDDHETNAVEDDDDAPLGPMRIKQESQKVSKVHTTFLFKQADRHNIGVCNILYNHSSYNNLRMYDSVSTVFA